MIKFGAGLDWVGIETNFEIGNGMGIGIGIGIGLRLRLGSGFGVDIETEIGVRFELGWGRDWIGLG